MSPDRSGNLLHLLGILESCAKVRRYSAGFGDAEGFFLAEDQLRYNACLTLLLNIAIVFHTVMESIPALEESLYRIIAGERLAGVFDEEEWEAARGSLFYRYVDFSRWGN